LLFWAALGTKWSQQFPKDPLGPPKTSIFDDFHVFLKVSRRIFACFFIDAFLVFGSHLLVQGGTNNTQQRETNNAQQTINNKQQTTKHKEQRTTTKEQSV